MGLLDKIDKRKQNMEVPDAFNLEFESMDEEVRSRFLGIWKKLFIRGTLGNQMEYSSVSNICVRDKVQDVICVMQGETSEQHFYCLIIKGEAWCVTGIKDRNTASGKGDAEIEAIYIPSKIGKVSTVDDKALGIAKVAVGMLSGGMYDSYINGLRGVLDEESIKSYTQMSDSWYEQIFNDENCRQLRDYQIDKFKENQLVNHDCKFVYEMVDDALMYSLEGILFNKIEFDKYKFCPKIGVKEEKENVRCYRLLKNVDFSDFNDIQYYLMFFEAEVILAGTVEVRETGDICIEKLTIFGQSNYNTNVVEKMMTDGIEMIQKIWYNKPTVKCANQVHTEKYEPDEKMKI